MKILSVRMTWKITKVTTLFLVTCKLDFSLQKKKLKQIEEKSRFALDTARFIAHRYIPESSYKNCCP